MDWIVVCKNRKLAELSSESDRTSLVASRLLIGITPITCTLNTQLHTHTHKLPYTYTRTIRPSCRDLPVGRTYTK